MIWFTRSLCKICQVLVILRLWVLSWYRSHAQGGHRAGAVQVKPRGSWVKCPSLNPSCWVVLEKLLTTPQGYGPSLAAERASTWQAPAGILVLSRHNGSVRALLCWALMCSYSTTLYASAGSQPQMARVKSTLTSCSGHVCHQSLLYSRQMLPPLQTKSPLSSFSTSPSSRKSRPG